VFVILHPILLTLVDTMQNLYKSYNIECIKDYIKKVDSMTSWSLIVSKLCLKFFIFVS